MSTHHISFNKKIYRYYPCTGMVSYSVNPWFSIGYNKTLLFHFIFYFLPLSADEVGLLLHMLVRFGHECEARSLQEDFRSLVTLLRTSMDEIWPTKPAEGQAASQVGMWSLEEHLCLRVCVHVCVRVCELLRIDIWRQFCVFNRISADTCTVGTSPVVKPMPINCLFIFKHIDNCNFLDLSLHGW